MGEDEERESRTQAAEVRTVGLPVVIYTRDFTRGPFQRANVPTAMFVARDGFISLSGETENNSSSPVPS